MIVKKAVFPVAGFGTRFLPATKAMPKELLPIVDKPPIQYAAEEAIAAGIDTLIFVTGRNKRAIEDHFDSNNELVAALRAKGEYERADMVRNILPESVECIFVRQPEQLGLGHAILCAERVIGSDPFAVLLADDFLTEYPVGVTADLVNAFQESGKSQLSVMKIDSPKISKYGVVDINKSSGFIQGIVEKPSFEEAPSNLASIGRYVFKSEIFKILRQQDQKVGLEIELADAINVLAKEGSIEHVMLKGKRFDCGSVEEYILAINHVYEAQKELNKSSIEHLT